MINKDRTEKKDQKKGGKPARKMSEYGRQLHEKQKVKRMYGVRERQFRRFFDVALHTDGAPGENLLSMLERRLDNVIYRLKMATSRTQSRQMVVHGHIFVNGKRGSSPSFQVKIGDQITIYPKMLEHKAFMENIVEKRLKLGIKVPEWLVLDKKSYTGRMLRNPVRADLQVPIEDYLIVELYSK